MLPWMGVAWFDIRKHPSGLVLHGPAQPDDGGNAGRVILTKSFDGPYMAALILGLSPEENAGLRPTSNGPDSRSFEGPTSK
jgi:hypothetical protein